MGSVKKKTLWRVVPENAELVETRRQPTPSELGKNPDLREVVELVATWRETNGKKQTGVIVYRSDGAQRVRTKSATWTAKYRDGTGIVCEVATGCRDRQAALAKLAELERMADKVRVGAVTEQDISFGRFNRTAIADHVADYAAYLEQEKKHPDYIKTLKRRLLEIFKACKFERLADLQADPIRSWLSTESEPRSLDSIGRSPAVLNGYVEAVVAFGYWLTGKRVRGKKSNQLGGKRLAQNPFAGLGKFDVESDRRRMRRALTEADLTRLLFVTRWRPLAEYGRETEKRTGSDRPDNAASRRTWTKRALTLETITTAVERAKAVLDANQAFVDELERRGQERALIYKVAILTGLRRGEIEALTLDHLRLNAPVPYLQMRPQDTKNRKAAEVPLRSDLADDLRTWIEAKRNSRNGVVSLERERAGLKPTERLFKVPKQLVKTLNRDLAAAGIPKKDERGRSIDVHALRHTFGTLLSAGGVAPRTAQEAMRHSDISLTMNVYTDPRLLDVAGAMEVLPDLRLSTSAVLTQQPTEKPARALMRR
jgi:integrase